jgi:hypothetical protein
VPKHSVIAPCILSLHGCLQAGDTFRHLTMHYIATRMSAGGRHVQTSIWDGWFTVGTCASSTGIEVTPAPSRVSELRCADVSSFQLWWHDAVGTHSAQNYTPNCLPTRNTALVVCCGGMVGRHTAQTNTPNATPLVTQQAIIRHDQGKDHSCLRASSLICTKILAKVPAPAPARTSFIPRVELIELISILLKDLICAMMYYL